MSLSIYEVASLEKVGETAWNGLFSHCPHATAFQSWAWITAWWLSRSDGTMWMLIARERGKLVGAAPLFIDAQGTLRFIGEGHADYGEFLCYDDRADVLVSLVEYVFAHAAQWRKLELACIPESSPLAAKLRRCGAWGVERIPCPRVLFSARPAESLLAKDSLRRHGKKLRARGVVEVQHFDCAEQIEPWLDPFFRQHCERWALTATPSPFANPRNEEFYRRLAREARPGGPILFTVLTLNGQPAAMHLGLRSQGEFIWYKPTYDPRLSSVGPGEVLLAELIRRAEQEGAKGLDFARGDERFKLRFSSEVRHVVSLTARPSRFRGLIDRARGDLRRSTATALGAIGLRAPIGSLWRAVKASRRGIRERGFKATLVSARERLQEYGPVRLQLYVRPVAASQFVTSADLSIRCATGLSEILELFELSDPEHQAVLADAPAYVATRAQLWVAQKEGETVTCGWELKGPDVSVGEIGARLELPERTAVLTDFRTFSRYRRRGYYGALLRGIRPTEGIEQHLIYALKRNAASIRAIEQSGFVPLGQMIRSVFGALRYCPSRPTPLVRLRYAKRIEPH